MTAHQCSTACDEIIRNDMHLPIIDMHKAATWLEKYQELYSEMDPIYTPATFSKFYDIYYTVKELTPKFYQRDEAERALQFYHNRVKKSKNKKMLLCWLVEFEPLENDLMALYYFYFNVDGEPTKEYVSINPKVEVYLHAEDFAVQLKFIHLYYNYYWKMLEKYTTIPEEMWTTLEEGSESSEKGIP
ncbi:MAG: hypothetical protein IPM95_12650 [Sphingobacteriales bacterium]|nr:hypothetical protein [Sphingobacteriales bacterium]